MQELKTAERRKQMEEGIKNGGTGKRMEEVKNLKYIRDRFSTYFEISTVECPEYVQKMLEFNQPENFLEMKRCVRADESVWKIFVTGEKSLDVVFRALPINYDGLSVILHGFTEVFSEADELLLPLEGILLDPKYIFVDIKDYKARFIYIPGLTHDIKSQTENFFEYLLNRVDYDDMRAVNLLYDCYTLSMKEGRGIEAIEARLKEEAGNTGDSEKTDVTAEKEEADTIQNEEPDTIQNEALFGGYEHFTTGYEVKPDAETKIKEWFMGLFVSKKKKKENEETRKEEIKKYAKNPKSINENSRNFKENLQNIKDGFGSGEFRMREEYEESDEYDNGESNYKNFENSGKIMADKSLYDMSCFVRDSEETVLLYGGAAGKTPYLKDIKGTVTSLTKSPFLIGSLMYHTDFMIKDASVSRLHAEISYDEKETVITDLNSTNGTYLNGELLVPKEKYILNEGDTVVIGQVSYVFGAGT